MTEETRSLVAGGGALLPSETEWRTMAGVADALVRSGLLPAHVKTPQAALAIMLKGRELGVPPMHALSNIVVVQGKPTCNAELMLALIYRDQGDEAVQIAETSAERCTLRYRRRGWKEAREYSFTLADARTAGLADTPTWKKFPAAMLRARCISAVARMAFPDSIAGMYGYEELGVSVAVEDGQVVLAEPEAAHDAASNGHSTGVTPAAVKPAVTVARAAASTVTAPVPHPARAEQVADLRAEVAHLLRADTTGAGKLPKGADAMTQDELVKTRVWLKTRAATARAAEQAAQQTAVHAGAEPAPARTPEPADEQDAPWPRSAAQWTRAQLRQRIQEASGVELKSGKDLLDLARAHGQARVSSTAEMTAAWLLGLYQALRAADYAREIKAAPDAPAVTLLLAEAISERDHKHLGHDHYTALCRAGEARRDELAAPLLAGAQVAS